MLREINVPARSTDTHSLTQITFQFQEVKMFSLAHPFLVVVVSEAGILELLHELVLLLLPPGELGQELPHGGDGESVGHGPEQESGVVWGLGLVVTRKAGLGAGW